MILAISISIIILIFIWIMYSTSLFDYLCAIITISSGRYHCKRRPKRIILIRHGESHGNEDSMIYAKVPDHAIGLTEKGREQARHCGTELRKMIGENDTLSFYFSPFRRAKETCQLICEAFSKEKIISFREDPRIREQEWGNLQDLSIRDTLAEERKKVGRFFYRFKNGESGADVYDRISSFMESLFREMKNSLMPNNNIVIVSHGLFIRLFLMRFYRWSVDKFHTLKNVNNCAYCILERSDEDGSFVLKTTLELYPSEENIRNEGLIGTIDEQYSSQKSTICIDQKDSIKDVKKDT